MKTIEISRLNQLFDNLLNFSTIGEVVAESESDPNDYETVNTYILKTSEGLYLRIKKLLDSYGENERIMSIEFVEPKVKMITDFETIS